MPWAKPATWKNINVRQSLSAIHDPHQSQRTWLYGTLFSLDSADIAAVVLLEPSVARMLGIHCSRNYDGTSLIFLAPAFRCKIKILLFESSFGSDRSVPYTDKYEQRRTDRPATLLLSINQSINSLFQAVAHSRQIERDSKKTVKEQKTGFYRTTLHNYN